MSGIHSDTIPYRKKYEAIIVGESDENFILDVGNEIVKGRYMHEALKHEKSRNSAAILAHPTSWWYADGEFITNIAATLGFELLAVSVDAMAIMGYSKGGI